MIRFFFLLVFLTFPFGGMSYADSPLALIYSGKGSCTNACTVALAIAAQEAGLTPRFVNEKEITDETQPQQVKELFAHAKVWVQPGGFAKDASEAMSEPLKDAITDFVAEGGGYVGFCAGAFLATHTIGTTGAEGLGLISGHSATYLAHPARPELNFSIENVRWHSHEFQIYFEGGPYFYDLDPSVEVVATYQDGRSPAAVRTEYGKGRVFLSGPHPEAPDWWWEKDEVENPAASARHVAVSMLRWAAHLEPKMLLAK